ncbi:MAG: hypothetical protein V1924_06130 [Candidatus Bathyarchaeota archaeon]
MSDPVIKGLVKVWFRLVAFLSLTAFAGVVVFIRTGISAGLFTSLAYIYAAVSGGLILLLLVWLKRKVDDAPEMIEGFLRRLGFYKAPET